MVLKYLSMAAALALAPLAAEAQSFRCVGKDGKKYYGQSVPPECAGVTVEQVSAQGNVLKRIEPQASDDERAKKQAEDAERQKQAVISREQGRRNNALLSTYASEKDVDDTRRRALEDNQRAMQDIEGKIAALKKRLASPKEDANGVNMELGVQQDLLAAKRKEMDAINAKYDDEKRRYSELTGRGK